VQFYKKIKAILEAIADIPPPPPAIIQQSQDSKLTFDEILDFIKKHEGVRNITYKDTLGIPTVGIGFNLLRPDAKSILNQVGLDYNKVLNKQQELSDEQVKDIFKITLSIAYKDAKKWIPAFDALPKNIKLAVLDLSFNLGYPRLSKFVKTREHITRGDYNSAAMELQKSKWATQVGQRAQSLIKLFSS
jgi:GH24 family phage-related lysozyme (muramidase)